MNAPGTVRASILVGAAVAAFGCLSAPRVASSASPSAESRHLDEAITGWHPRSRERLNELLDAYGSASPTFDRARPPVAVFDWDNTVLKNDIGDATFFWMLNHDAVLQPANGDWGTTSPALSSAAKAGLERACGALAKPGEPLPTRENVACADAIFAAYVDEKATDGSDAFPRPTTRIEYAYAWLTQLTAGHTPEEIRGFARSAYAENAGRELGATQKVGSHEVTGSVRIYEQQRDLIRALRANGFDVWIVTASPQYVVEAISEHAGVPPDHVVGVRTVMRDGRATAELEGCGELADGSNAVMTFDEGKRCWINKVIFRLPPAEQLRRQTDPAKRPVFVAGDSDTDIAMLKDASALRLVIDNQRTQIMCNALANAHDRWLWEPMFLAPRPPRTTPYPCSTATDANGARIVDEDGAPFAKDYAEPAER